MAKKDSWIKEQLKKGYKKEQIKEGLKKAGYQQNTIDSVDSFAKKNKQTKQLLIGFSVFLVAVIIIWVIIGNYAAKKEETTNVNNLSFSGYYPNNLNELDTFVSLCENFLDEGLEIKKQVLDNEEEVLCLLALDKNYGTYIPSFRATSFELAPAQYICISIKLNNLIKEKFPDISEEDSFHVCSIIKPSLDYPSAPRVNREQNLVFPEGEIFCNENLKLDKSQFASFTGFIPKADSFIAEIYLVPQESIPEILAKESFSEAEEIIKSNTLLWQIIKPIK